MFTAGDEEQFESTRNKSKTFYEEHVKNFDPSETLSSEDIWDGYYGTFSDSVTDTFRYIFYKFKKGVYIRIKDNKLVTFLPFSNANFVNEWSHLIHPPKGESMISFFRKLNEKEGRSFDEKKVNTQVDKWYANNGLLRYEFPIAEGDTGIVHMKDMFETLCAKRTIPDAEFFINRRDFPLLKKDGTEAYDNIFNSDSHPLISHRYDKYTPILSSVKHESFADIPIPTLEDWARVKATCSGEEFKEFPKTPAKQYVGEFSTPWEHRKPIAVFRGSSTGIGVDIETNPRLKVSYLSSLKEKDPKDSLPFLDAGITEWKLRPRKIKGQEELKTIDTDSLPFSKVEKLSPEDQSKFKFIINIDGHSSAFRLSLEMRMGSVILLIDSEYGLWFKKLLIPFVHYVPVKKDLSDLVEKIQWCKSHDQECRNIVKNCLEFYDQFLTKDALLDYLQKVLTSVSLCQIISYKSKRKMVSKEDPKIFPTFDEKDLILLHNGKNSKVFVDRSKKFVIKVSEKEDLMHELMIGQKFSNLRNFVKTLGLTDQGMLVSQFIEGKKLDLGSPIKIIFAQVALSLLIAQQQYGFVHCDLMPWNLVIQEFSQNQDIFYSFSAVDSITLKTKFVPVIFDFEKSKIFDPAKAKLKTCHQLFDMFCLIIGYAKNYVEDQLPRVIFDMINFFACSDVLKEPLKTWKELRAFVKKFSKFAILSTLKEKNLGNKTLWDFFVMLNVPHEITGKITLKAWGLVVLEHRLLNPFKVLEYKAKAKAE